MRIIYAKHEPYWDTGHLGHVIEQMQTQGAPIIRVDKLYVPEHDDDLK